MLLPAIMDGNKPGEPYALKVACTVRERGVGNVSTPTVRDRRVLVRVYTLVSPFGSRDNAPASYFMKLGVVRHANLLSLWSKWLGRLVGA